MYAPEAGDSATQQHRSQLRSRFGWVNLCTDGTWKLSIPVPEQTSPWLALHTFLAMLVFSAHLLAQASRSRRPQPAWRWRPLLLYRSQPRKLLRRTQPYPRRSARSHSANPLRLWIRLPSRFHPPNSRRSNNRVRPDRRPQAVRRPLRTANSAGPARRPNSRPKGVPADPAGLSSLQQRAGRPG